MRDDTSRRSSSTVHQSSADVDVSQLAQLLLHGDGPARRRRAAELLGQINVAKTDRDRSAIANRLIEAVVTDSDLGVQMRAIESLYGYGEKYIERLVTKLIQSTEPNTDPVAFFKEWLDAEHSELRLVAVSSFHRFDDERIVSWLHDALDDPDPRVRSRAVEAYCRRDSASVEPVRPVFQDEYTHVRRAATKAITEIDDRDALESLIPIARNDDDEIVRRTAVEHIYRLDNQRVFSTLLVSLADPAEGVRRASLISLLRIASADSTVTPAEMCLSVVESPDAPPVSEVTARLDSLLEESLDGDLRQTAMEVLGELVIEADTKDLHGVLINRLDEKDDSIAEIALEYLRRIEGDRLEKPLRMYIRNDERSAAGRKRAESLLEEIRTETATALERKSIQYTYVSEPSDYTIEHGRNTE